MDTNKVVAALNTAIALENTAALQYKQHAVLVSGLWRKVYADFFASESADALEHARKFARKVVALGGVPTVELGSPVRQSTELEEMLRQDLELERATLQAYIEAHRCAEENIALRTMLENQIESEQRAVEELERYLGLVNLQGVEREIHLQRAS